LRSDCAEGFLLRVEYHLLEGELRQDYIDDVIESVYALNLHIANKVPNRIAGGCKIFEYLQTFLHEFRTFRYVFHELFKRFRLFSNVSKHELAHLVLPHFTQNNGKLVELLPILTHFCLVYFQLTFHLSPYQH
jgi:hypothetical protein